jgi:hypothetical protein
MTEPKTAELDTEQTPELDLEKAPEKTTEPKPEDGKTIEQLRAEDKAKDAELQKVRHEAAGKRHVIKNIVAKLGLESVEDLDPYLANIEKERLSKLTTEQRLQITENSLEQFKTLAKNQAVKLAAIDFAGRSVDPSLTMRVLRDEPELKTELVSGDNGQPSFRVTYQADGKDLTSGEMADAFFTKYPALEKFKGKTGAQTPKTTKTQPQDGVAKVGVKPHSGRSKHGLF